jgi:hypothetical protein
MRLFGIYKNYFAVATGSDNAFLLSVDPALTGLEVGDFVCFQANHTISGNATININSLGAVFIVDNDGNNISSGIESGYIISMVFNGSNFVLLSYGKLPSKSDVGLGNVDNTSDEDKPVSNATQTALNAKITGTLVTSVGNPGTDTNIPSEQAVREAITSATSSSSIPSYYHPFLYCKGA